MRTVSNAVVAEGRLRLRTRSSYRTTWPASTCPSGSSACLRTRTDGSTTVRLATATSVKLFSWESSQRKLTALRMVPPRATDGTSATVARNRSSTTASGPPAGTTNGSGKPTCRSPRRPLPFPSGVKVNPGGFSTPFRLNDSSDPYSKASVRLSRISAP